MTKDELVQIVANGSGFCPEDGSEHSCGDLNKNGKPCIMYAEARRRCLILGEQLEVKPSMSCIYDITSGSAPNDAVGGIAQVQSLLAKELMTPKEVGLTETYEGATCKRCDFKVPGSPSAVCHVLTTIAKILAGWFDVDLGEGYAFPVDSGSCCNFWRRYGVERVIT